MDPGARCRLTGLSRRATRATATAHRASPAACARWIRSRSTDGRQQHGERGVERDDDRGDRERPAAGWPAGTGPVAAAPSDAARGRRRPARRLTRHPRLRGHRGGHDGSDARDDLVERERQEAGRPRGSARGRRTGCRSRGRDHADAQSQRPPVPGVAGRLARSAGSRETSQMAGRATTMPVQTTTRGRSPLSRPTTTGTRTAPTAEIGATTPIRPRRGRGRGTPSRRRCRRPASTVQPRSVEVAGSHRREAGDEHEDRAGDGLGAQGHRPRATYAARRPRRRSRPGP